MVSAGKISRSKRTSRATGNPTTLAWSPETLSTSAAPELIAPATAAGRESGSRLQLTIEVDDVDAKLAAMGADANITAGPMSFDAFIPGWRTAWVADPDGNIVEISQGYVDAPGS